MGMDVATTTSALGALQQLREKPFDMVISDIRLAEMSGVELVKAIKTLTLDIIFILVTAHASLETAIDAQQHGAYGYLTKPFKSKEEVRQLVLKALEKRTYKAEQAPKRHTDAQQSQVLFQALHKNQIVGRSQRMLEVCHAIGTVAATDSTVLINGESGTGKELVARAIHEASPRQAGPFVSINCGAFPETLLESELFGYLKGAFTGATQNKRGLFELADGGTIFLDEISEMSVAMQVKLLRALQERKVRPLGSDNDAAIAVRVIAATNKDLSQMVTENGFREDLYYRITVIPINVPPLRERP